MAIVLNEYEWAERAIMDRQLGKKPGETLSRVAKCYFENGYSRRAVRQRLDQFLQQCDPDASLVRWSDTLDRIVKSAARYPLIQIDHIDVYENEMKWIESVEGAQARRLLFTMVCVARYWNTVLPDNNNWLNTVDKEVFLMANVKVSSAKQDLMYGQLIKNGYIRQSKRIDNLNVQILSPEPDTNKVAVSVRDFRNIGYQYMWYCGGDFFICEHCGLTVKVSGNAKKPRSQHTANTGRKKKYCPSCAAIMDMRQTIDSVMRRRQIKS